MFYLLKKISINQIEVGEEVMVLADFSGIPAGTKGVVKKTERNIISIVWNGLSGGVELVDGFTEDELEYLAFKTERHPWKGGIADPRPAKEEEAES
jgi:hypothetical protein